MIYYWKGAEGSASLLATHGSAIERLLSGDYAPADLEKFKHASKHIIYSYRVTARTPLRRSECSEESPWL